EPAGGGQSEFSFRPDRDRQGISAVLRAAKWRTLFSNGRHGDFLLGRSTDVIAHYIDVRRAHKFNFIRIMAMGDGFWPFGGTPDNPDYTVIYELALRKMDWVFDYAAARGMNIELILWGYGVEGGEGLWRNEHDQHLWVD